MRAFKLFQSFCISVRGRYPSEFIHNRHIQCDSKAFVSSLQVVNMLQWVMHRVLILVMAIWGAQGCSPPESCTTPAPSTNTSKDFCYSARIRSTVLQGLPFGGVPTVLALDFMCFLVSLSMFSLQLSGLRCVHKWETPSSGYVTFVFSVM